MSLVVRLWIRRKVRTPEISLVIAYVMLSSFARGVNRTDFDKVLAVVSWGTSYAALQHGAGVAPDHVGDEEYVSAGKVGQIIYGWTATMLIGF